MLEYIPSKRIRPLDSLKHPFFLEKGLLTTEYFNEFSEESKEEVSDEEEVSNGLVSEEDIVTDSDEEVGEDVANESGTLTDSSLQSI